MFEKISMMVIVSFLTIVTGSNCVLAQETSTTKSGYNVNKEDLKYSVLGIIDDANYKEIFVYTEGRKLQVTPFVDKLKRIIKKISLQFGNKIAIDFYDDEETLTMVYLSNKKLIPLNKKELSKRDKHNLATYGGGIGISSYQYSLSIWDGSGNYLIPMTKYNPTTKNKKSMYCSVDILNVRNGAGAHHEKIGIIKKNDKITIQKESGAWVYFMDKDKYPNGGWVNKNYLTARKQEVRVKQIEKDQKKFKEWLLKNTAVIEVHFESDQQIWIRLSL